MENLNYRNCNEEVTVKLIGKLTMEFPELEVNLPKQLEVKRLVEEVLYGYEVTTKETALVTSDLEERVNYFLATKKLEGLSEAMAVVADNRWLPDRSQNMQQSSQESLPISGII